MVYWSHTQLREKTVLFLLWEKNLRCLLFRLEQYSYRKVQCYVRDVTRELSKPMAAQRLGQWQCQNEIPCCIS
ncbi:hypothetical protein BS78_04G038100 [Paspalum vaginatum]|nr:hypothetical protein BS78_04G038100 [Paspalum vaginatum]